MNLIYVALGGAFGSVMRYLAQSLIGHVVGNAFPWGTLIVNITGSLAMGVLIGWLVRTMPPNAPDLRLLLAVGVLGGYTTFSSFSLDAITLLQQQRWAAMAIYILLSVSASLAGLIVGLHWMRTGA